MPIEVTSRLGSVYRPPCDVWYATGPNLLSDTFHLYFPEIVRGGVLVEPYIRCFGPEKRRSRDQSRSRQEGDGSLDLDEEKRSCHPRAHRFEFENPPSAEAYLRIPARPAALPWNFLLSSTQKNVDRESRAIRDGKVTDR